MRKKIVEDIYRILKIKNKRKTIEEVSNKKKKKKEKGKRREKKPVVE